MAKFKVVMETCRDKCHSKTVLSVIFQLLSNTFTEQIIKN